MSLNAIWDILYIFFLGINFHELKVLQTSNRNCKKLWKDNS